MTSGPAPRTLPLPPARRPARLPALAPALLLLAVLHCAPARAAAPDLLLEVRVGPHLLSDGVGAWQGNDDIFLPLGELSKLLTIAIRTSPAEGQASGYILDEKRGFHLDLAQKTVLRGELREAIDPLQVRQLPDDIYVSTRLLAAWLPVDFALDLATLSLVVTPREKLPLQARLDRSSMAASSASFEAAAGAADPGYPRSPTPYRMIGAPFADQTLGLDLRRAPGRSADSAGNAAASASSASYTAYLTGDLLGAEAALYLNTGSQRVGAPVRLTLGRHDPDAVLLGPLRARTVQVGSVPAPGIPNIAFGSAIGNGVHISNRTLGQPLRSDRHTFQGDLPPGWDVELYFNGALAGLQQSRPDGRYSFDDQPLIYGFNEFRLVFHGPLGQVRIERHAFLIEQSMLAPGEIVYSVTALRDDDGRGRAAAQLEWGLGSHLSASAGVARVPVGGQERNYAELGLQAYFKRVIVSGAVARSNDGGALAQAGVRTRVGQIALNASRTHTRAFTSDFYQSTADPVRLRDEVRADGMLAGLPVSLYARRDRLESSATNLELAGRVSAYRYGTAFSNALRWQSLAGQKHADGMLQASRRVAGVGVSGQLHYGLEPDTALSSITLAADKYLAAGYMVNAGVSRTFTDPHYRFSAGLNKSLGSFGLGVSGYYSSRGDYGLGLQLFLALGQDPRSKRWLADAAPMAGSGAASARVFVDRNRNGVMDGDDAPVAGAGFVVNGGALPIRTDAQGLAWLGRLSPNQHADIGIDGATLEDPQWLARKPGLRIVPRAGKVSELDFAVEVTGEIDGTAFQMSHGARRPAGGLDVELVDADNKVAAATGTTADGYYVLAGVAPGAYRLRLAPAQLAKLKLACAVLHQVVMNEDGTFINGKDFVVTADAAP